MTRISWTALEQRNLATAILEEVGTEKLTNRDIVTLVKKYQKIVLVDGRQRAIKSIFNLTSFAKMLDIMQAAAIKNRIVAVIADPTETEPTEVKGNAPITETEPTEVKTNAPITSADNILSQMLDIFLNAIAERVAAKINTTLLSQKPVDIKVAVPNTHLPRIKHNPSAESNGRTRTVAIGVVGLLPVQQKTIVSAFSGSVCFKFYDKAPKDPPSVDYMIGMVGFFGHSVDATLAKQFGSRYIRLSNGITQLSNKVQEICTKFYG